MTPSVTIVGWTLIHFVWQGTLVAGALAVALRLLRSAAPNARYAVACIALGALLMVPIVTARVLSVEPPVRSAPAPTISAQEQTTTPLQVTRTLRPDEGIPEGQGRGLDGMLTTLVAVWSFGVLFFGVRLAGGWWHVQRIRRTSLGAGRSAWQASGDRMARALGLAPVPIADSPWVDTPTLVGWLTPVVLLPAAALANLTPGQVEAILAHELAHVRRHDYAVNFLQRLTETVLFYHPAVWWVSSRIRAEREACCDDVAVAVCGDAVRYASALAELAAGRVVGARLGLAATDGSLMVRIRHVLRPRHRDERPAAATMGALVLLFVATGALQYVSLSAVADEDRGSAEPQKVSGAAGPQASQQTTPPPPPPPPPPRRDRQTAETDHFAITYDPVLAPQVEQVGREAESAYVRVSADLRHDLPFRLELFLYQTRTDLQRGIRLGEAGPLGRDRILIALDTPGVQRFGMILHEVAHSFVFDILDPSRASVPVWMLEGFGEYLRGDWDPTDRATLRDLVLSGSVPRIGSLPTSGVSGNPRLTYSLGHAAFEFIESRWGKDGVRALLAAMRGTGSVPESVQAAFDTTVDAFDEGLASFLAEQLAGIVPGSDSATFAGTLRDGAGDPMGDNLVFLSHVDTREQHRAMTDQDGRFTFPDLSGGRYLVTSTTVRLGRVEVTIPDGVRVERDLMASFGPFREFWMVALANGPSDRPSFAWLPPDWVCGTSAPRACGPPSLVQELEEEAASQRRQSTRGPQALRQDERLQFPASLQASADQGAVTVEGLVGTDGVLRSPRVVSASNSAVERAALAAVREWRWEPALMRGSAVEVPLTVQLQFVIPRSAPR